MVNPNDWSTGKEDSDITIADALAIAEYCRRMNLAVPAMKICNAQNNDFAEGLTFSEALDQNNFPPLMAYNIVGNFPARNGVQMAAIRTAATANDLNGKANAGFEDYFTLLQFTRVEQLTRQQALLLYMNQLPSIEAAILASIPQLKFPSQAK